MRKTNLNFNNDFFRNELGLNNKSNKCCTTRSNCSCVNNYAMDREPDGIDVHVDRPLEKNFATFGEWCDAMAKYRSLEKIAKECNWECREPMKGFDGYVNVPNHITEQPTHHNNFNCFEDKFEHDFDEFEDENDDFVTIYINLFI